MEQTSTPVAERTHPVHAFAGRAHHALDHVTGSPAWAMTAAEQVETLDDLHRLEARLTELRWRVLAAADRNQPGAKHGATSTAAWLSHRTHMTRVRANTQLRGARWFTGDDRGGVPGVRDAQSGARGSSRVT